MGLIEKVRDTKERLLKAERRQKKKSDISIIISTEKPLTKEQRKNFKKENPGCKLCFSLRHPNFPLIISIISLLLVVGKPILIGMLQWLQTMLLP